MKRHLTVLAAVVALCVPAAALADDATTTPTASNLASLSCKTQRTQLGAATFKLTYATLGKCVSKAVQSAKADIQNAAKQCKTEIAAAGGKKANGAAANAFGKCVSEKAKASSQAEASAVVSAAKTCKSQRSADKSAFAAKYATFGACVSKTVASS